MIQLIKKLRTNTLTMIFNLLTLMNTTTGSWLVVCWIKTEKIIRLVIRNNWDSTRNLIGKKTVNPWKQASRPRAKHKTYQELNYNKQRFWKKKKGEICLPSPSQCFKKN